METNQEQTKQDKKYNGWTNYETWAVKLWMDNSEGDQQFFKEMANEAIKTEIVGTNGQNMACYHLSQSLKDYFDEANPLGDQATCFTDLLNAALSEVNWYEIAQTLIDDLN